MKFEEFLDIIEYQFGKKIKIHLEKIKENLEIKKFKSKKLEIYYKNRLLLILNPKFFIFSIGEDFAKILKNCNSFYIRIKNEFLEDIRKTKNIVRKNIIEYSNDFRCGNDIIILNENDNIIGIAKAKFNSKEIEKSTYGIIAKIKKFLL